VGFVLSFTERPGAFSFLTHVLYIRVRANSKVKKEEECPTFFLKNKLAKKFSFFRSLKTGLGFLPLLRTRVTQNI